MNTLRSLIRIPSYFTNKSIIYLSSLNDKITINHISVWNHKTNLLCNSQDNTINDTEAVMNSTNSFFSFTVYKDNITVQNTNRYICLRPLIEFEE